RISQKYMFRPAPKKREKNYDSRRDPQVLPFIVLFLSGASLTFAFAPFYAYGMAVFAPATLLLFLNNTNRLQGFLRGLIFGIGFFGTAVSWVFVSIHQYAHVDIITSSVLTFCFIMLFALFIATQSFLFVLSHKYYSNSYFRYLILFPMLWILFEAIRGWFLTGFPWVLIAYSQTNSPLKGYVPILGEYGVGFIILFSSGLLGMWLELFYNSFYKKNKIKLNNRLIVFTFVAMIIWLSGYLFAQIPWTKPDGPKIKVSLIQGNIPQEIKWSSEYFYSTIARYMELSQLENEDVAVQRNQIIIWPESAIAAPSNQVEDLLEALKRDSNANQLAFITSIPIPVPDSFQYYNGMIVLGDGQGYYYKRHLVPFGEYVPLMHFLGHLLEFMAIPMSDFAAGPHNQPPLIAKGIVIGPFICYEVAYADALKRVLPKAEVLLTVSNDAWFGHSFAGAQHLQIAQFRALQSGRPMLFVSNTGPTAIINQSGQVQEKVPEFKAVRLTGFVQPMQGATPWVMIGNSGIVVFILLFVLFVYRPRKGKK
ncbi:MAG: apolipoprotein N-acyltransferase, partial [Gammaproteobacteria bacterium]